MSRNGEVSLRSPGRGCFVKQKRYRQQAATLSCSSPASFVVAFLLLRARDSLILSLCKVFHFNFCPGPKQSMRAVSADCCGTNMAGPIRAASSAKISARQKNDHCVSSAASCVCNLACGEPLSRSSFAGTPACITALT